MISSYNSTTETVAVGAAYDFDTNRIVPGCTVGHVPGTSVFTLTKPGYYYVTFNTTFTTTAAGDVSVELQNGGVAVPGATGSVTITTVGDTASIAFTSIIKVLPSCSVIDNTASLTFVVGGTEVTASTASVNITKLC